MARKARTNLIIGTIATLGTVAVGIGAVAVGTSFATAEVDLAAWEDTIDTGPDDDTNDSVTTETPAEAGVQAETGRDSAATDEPSAPTASTGEPAGASPTAPAEAAPAGGDGSGLRTGPTLPRTGQVLVENDGPRAEVVSIACDATVVLVFGLVSPDGVGNVTVSYGDWTESYTVNLVGIGGSKYRFKAVDTKGSGFRNMTVGAKDSLGNVGTTFIGDVCTGGPGSLTDL